MWFSVALMKFHWSGINWHVFNQSECINCCLYVIIQKIAPQAKSGKYFQIWFSPDLGGKNGGALSMRMQVILDSSFARPGSAPIWGGKKGEFRDWTNWFYNQLETNWIQKLRELQSLHKISELLLISQLSCSLTPKCFTIAKIEFSSST